MLGVGDFFVLKSVASIDVALVEGSELAFPISVKLL